MATMVKLSMVVQDNNGVTGPWRKSINGDHSPLASCIKRLFVHIFYSQSFPKQVKALFQVEPAVPLSHHPKVAMLIPDEELTVFNF